MGQIADALRANLRELAQSDARSLRALDEELRAATTTSPSKPAAALPDGLERLTTTQLRARCKAAGLSRYSRLTKPELLALLRNGMGAGGTTQHSRRASPSVEDRLARVETLLLLVAEQVGVPREKVNQLLGS